MTTELGETKKNKNGFTDLRQTDKTLIRIKVVGIGQAGINAVNDMIINGLKGVEFIAVDRDEQTLNLSKAQSRIKFGENLKSPWRIHLEDPSNPFKGEYPDFGYHAAEKARDILIAQLKGADLVFVVAGMGGVTGNGAASVIARYAHEIGALSVGVVSMPLPVDNGRWKHYKNFPDSGAESLQEWADTTIVIHIDRVLLDIERRKKNKEDVFPIATNTIAQIVHDICNLVFTRGLTKVNTADIRSILYNAGSAQAGIGNAKGENGAVVAAEAAIHSPLINESIKGARDVLLTINSGKELSMSNVTDILKVITASVDPEADIIYGTFVDEKLDDEVCVTVMATKIRPVKKIYTREYISCGNQT